MLKTKLCFLLTLICGVMYAQTKISGKVVDSTNEPLPGASVVEKGTSNGTSTNFDGLFELTVADNATLVVSFTGYETTEVSVNGKTNFTIVLKDGVQLDEVVITGSRTPVRSNIASPLPIDIVGVKELQSTGQATFDKTLQYKIPSFNTVQTPVNDATSLLDPYEIRNLGPSRTLILINGKRKNLSSLLYTQTSPGRGETGADISGIPIDAIKTIQVLRDGASAQYGSDAIAGVMNVILKDDYANSSATFRAGITGEGDGEMIGVSINGGDEIGDDKGFINYTIDVSKTALANRPGTVNAEGEFADFGGARPGETLADVREFLSRRPDAGNINGSPETSAAKFLINGSFKTAKDKDLYFNAAYVYKKVNSFANYRTPYWRDIQDFPYLGLFFPGANPTNTGTYTDALGTSFNGNGYDGYLPTFEGDLADYNATLGLKGKINGWNTDASITVGGNRQTYLVNNSHNRAEILDANGEYVYRQNSPISFQPGGTAFNHIVGNIDISKIINDKLSFAIGTEVRGEFFDILEGQLSSYEGIGADSFAGNRPENSGEFSRYNIGGYVSASFDATEDLLFEGTLRAENYSDFGTTFVWKASSRYKFLDDKYTLRASVSTGFRAPTLHQIYTQKSQFSFVAGQGIQVVGLVNNVSPQARQLGVPKLKAEESTNFTVGFGAKPIKNLSFTVDYYNIQIDDRIVLGNEIDFSGTGLGLGTLSFFSNAIDTRTSGIDVVIGYKGIELGEGKLGLNLSGNYTIENERTDNNGSLLVDQTQESLLFTSRPQTKWILGANYTVNKFDFNIGNTYFGKTTFHQAGLDSNLRTEFIPKIVTDLGINYNATKNITIAANINNIFNVLPEWEFVAENQTGQDIINSTAITATGLTQIQNEANLITFNQRYSQMTYDGYHFSQLGTLFNLSVNYRF
ncbi:TonB-dependent receptor [Tenacibaculum jejuense]|uniref:Probable TonB-dependent outer membrane receptor n=1 Tax=Tenacibaculum jejuense TaxID=584609 RepID=A0A238U9N7_9FLAO|nr:TonB-dependent receptor [Tenacibaculum jejuense]SNR15909.1 Probable TonB-dependent outer membrane receptor precursor [Tenacibaculum jejuense]